MSNITFNNMLGTIITLTFNSTCTGLSNYSKNIYISNNQFALNMGSAKATLLPCVTEITFTMYSGETLEGILTIPVNQGKLIAGEFTTGLFTAMVTNSTITIMNQNT